jgi:hypothetical protein
MSTETKVALQQETIFTLLKMHSNERGYVKDLNTERIHKLTGVSLHDVSKTLWGLQKRGLIGFSEKKGQGNHSYLMRFRITKKGLAVGQEEVRAAIPIEVPESAVVEETQAPVSTSSPSQEQEAITNPTHVYELIEKEVILRRIALLAESIQEEDLALSALDKCILKEEVLRELKVYFEYG